MTDPITPTVSQVLGWQIKIDATAPAAEQIAQALRDAADTMNSTIDGLNWEGDGRTAADDRSDRELQQMRALATEFDDLATESRTHHANLDAMVSKAKSTVERLRSNEFNGVNFYSVAEDWTVTDGTDWKALYEKAGDNQDAIDTLDRIKSVRANSAANDTVMLQQLAHDIGIEDAATADAITGILDAVEQLAPESTTDLTPEAAEQDGKAIADGSATTEEIARIGERLSELNLSDDQLHALERGEQVDLPPAELAYLQAFYNYAGKDGLLGFSKQLTEDGSPEALATNTSLANGLLTLSQEKVVTKDDKGNVVDHGGMAKLDPEIREFIETRPSLGGDLPDATTVGLTDKLQLGSPGNRADYAADITQFGNLIGSADKGYQPGTELGVDLTRQGANLAGLADQGFRGDGLMLDVGDTTIQKYVEIGTRNEDSNYALITGNDPDGVLGTDYHRDNVMVPLLSHEWDDNGAALGDGMFGWIADDAHVEGDVPTPANQRAGEAAFGLAQILSSTEAADGSNLYERWLDMGIPEGGQDDSLGQVNPELTRSMAEALSPYAGDLVGMPEDYTHTAGFGELGGPIETVRVLSVLDGDIVAGTTMNGAMLSESMRMNETYASMATSGEQVNPRLMGEYANRLTWAVEAGLDAEYSERDVDTHENNDRISDKKTMLNAAYTAAQISIGGLSAPAAGVMALTAFPQADIVDALGGHEQETGPHNPAYREDIGPINYDYNPTTDGSDSHRKYAFLQSLVQQGAIDVNTLDPSLTKQVDGKTVLATYTDFQNNLRNMHFDEQTTSTNAVTNALTGAGLEETKANAYLNAADNPAYTKRYDDLIANGPTQDNANIWNYRI